MAAPTYLQRRVRIANARSLGRRWRTHAGFVVTCALVVVVIAVLPMPAWWRGILVGVVLGAGGMAVLASVTRLGDPLVRGELAEQWSIEALREAGRWLVTSNVAFDRVDVDHVAVTPAGVLAVETKYRGAGYNAEVNQQRHRRELAAAERGARKVRLLLQSKKLRDCAVVLPVLIVWGPGKPTLESGYHLDGGVYVLDGDHPKLWAHLFSAATVDEDLRRRLHGQIQQFAQSRTGFDNRHQPGLNRAMWTALRAGIADSTAERRRRTDLQKTLQRPPPSPPAAQDS